MKVSAFLSIALAALVTSLPAGQEQGKKELVARYQQVGRTEYNNPNVGLHIRQQPILITGGCVSIPAPCNSFYLATGYRARFYRDNNCNNRIGGQEGQAGRNNQRFDTYEFNSYTAWEG